MRNIIALILLIIFILTLGACSKAVAPYHSPRIVKGKFNPVKLPYVVTAKTIK